MPKSGTERPRKTKIGTEVAQVTRDSDTTFKVKGQLAGAGHIVAASCTALYICGFCVCLVFDWLIFITLRAELSSAVYCNRCSLYVCVFVWMLCVCGSVTTIT